MRNPRNPYPLPDSPLTILLDQPTGQPSPYYIWNGETWIEPDLSNQEITKTEAPHNHRLLTEQGNPNPSSSASPASRPPSPKPPRPEEIQAYMDRQALRITNEMTPRVRPTNLRPIPSPDVQRLILLLEEQPLVGEMILAALRWIALRFWPVGELWAWKAHQILNRCSPGWDHEEPPEIPERLKVGWEWTGGR